MGKSKVKPKTQGKPQMRVKAFAVGPRPVVPQSLTDEAIHALWLRSKRGDASAQRALHALLMKFPRTVPELLRVFEVERRRHLKARFGWQPPVWEKPKSPWQKSLGAPARHSGIVSGGLPTLGKRR